MIGRGVCMCTAVGLCNDTRGGTCAALATAGCWRETDGGTGDLPQRFAVFQLSVRRQPRDANLSRGNRRSAVDQLREYLAESTHAKPMYVCWFVFNAYVLGNVLVFETVSVP